MLPWLLLLSAKSPAAAAAAVTTLRLCLCFTEGECSWQSELDRLLLLQFDGDFRFIYTTLLLLTVLWCGTSDFCLANGSLLVLQQGTG
jgi:hypothetical protein